MHLLALPLLHMHVDLGGNVWLLALQKPLYALYTRGKSIIYTVLVDALMPLKAVNYKKKIQRQTISLIET